LRILGTSECLNARLKQKRQDVPKDLRQVITHVEYDATRPVVTGTAMKRQTV
jgi:hypothetical protein